MFFKFEVNAGTRDWVFHQYQWALSEGLLTTESKLIEPTSEFFPSARGTPDETVAGLVKSIQLHLNIADAQISVAPAHVLPEEHRHDYNSLSSVGGTWQAHESGEALISYDPAMLSKKAALLSTLVHEVMHHRLALSSLEVESHEELELVTDLHCITTGFGAIAMAGAEQMGWQGYLRQDTRAFALAVFCRLTGSNQAEVEGFLPPNARWQFRRASKYTNRFDNEILELRT